jgi:NAD(P)-dependent dehydrogenase (short-subunit alcohol dehydrogenase family)
MSNPKLFVVVGSGPGIGVATAIKFASEGFNIALLSRNPERLQEDVTKVQDAAKGEVTIKTFPVDAADHVALKKTLEEVQQIMGSPEVVLYNVARIAPSTIGETEPEYLLDDFKVSSPTSRSV